MSSAAPGILTINGGSSSIKFAIFRATLERVFEGSVERCSPAELLSAIEKHAEFANVGAVGHRIVHGMRLIEPTRIDAALLAKLREISPFVPEHLPREIALVEEIRARHPRLTQVACFDTAFHQGMPRIAKMIAIPRRFDAAGVQRYGFHGLSYQFLIEELARRAGENAAKGRVILAHLGGGASLAALSGGKPLDTSMGFTPASGLMMGTRSGDIDPGVIAYLARTERMSEPEIETLVSHESGLLGVSETSADMRELLARESADPRASEAIDLFCYQARKWVGAFAAVLGGVDTIVFSGGIGEHAASVRARICDGLQHLGLEIDAAANARNSVIVSSAASRVTIHVMHTDEELMIARSVARLLGPAK